MTVQASSELTKVHWVPIRAGFGPRARAGCLWLLTAISAACGGPKYHIDDAVLSDLPLQDKQRMLAVQGEINQANEEKNKAQSDIATDDRDIAVAEAESSQARLESGKLEANLRLAERSQDLNRIGPAKASFNAANSPKNTSEAKLKWLQHRRDYHRILVEVAELHGTYAERRYELEKARLTQATGKLPSRDFNVAQFEGQAAQAQKRYDQARARADKQQTETSQLEQVYTQLSSSRPST
jgi:chromosome segregation ATPase